MTPANSLARLLDQALSDRESKKLERNAGAEYAVYRWDHERPEKFEFFATDLRSALERAATEEA